MLEMLGSFDRWNLKIGKLGMLRMNVGNLLGMMWEWMWGMLMLGMLGSFDSNARNVNNEY